MNDTGGLACGQSGASERTVPFQEKNMARILSVVLFLGVTTVFLPWSKDTGEPVSAQVGKPIPADVQKKLDALRKDIAAKKMTFSVGHSKAAERPLSQLCGLTM